MKFLFTRNIYMKNISFSYKKQDFYSFHKKKIFDVFFSHEKQKIFYKKTKKIKMSFVKKTKKWLSLIEI